MQYLYKHIFAGIQTPIDKHTFHINIVSSLTWNFVILSYKTHCAWFLRWIYTAIDPQQMTCDEHFIRERTGHLVQNISSTNCDFFPVIWTGLRKSLNNVSITYDYVKDINLVTKMGQITIKLAISTAFCNIGIYPRPVTSASNSDLPLTL
jgi:hypothetical protein